MDHKRINQEIKEIVKISSSVPETYQVKCFEILLSNLLMEHKPPRDASEYVPPPPGGEKIPNPAQVRVFMRKTGVTDNDLKAIALYEAGELHFVKEPHHDKVAKGQIEWALLLALKNAIVSNSLTVDPEDIRSICQEKGYYDATNFAAIFKAPRNAKLFKKPLEPQGSARALSLEGIQALGELVKSLAGASQ